MAKRSHEWWIFGAVVVVLAGCSSSDETGNSKRGNGTTFLPTSGGGPSATAGAGGSSSLGNVGNPTMAAAERMKIMQDGPCASVSLVANRVLPTVMLVVDGSGSMETGYGPIPDGGTAPGPNMAAPGQSTRWQAVREALVNPDNGVVPALQGLVRFGLATFGTVPTCPLPTPIIDPALNNYNAINGALPVNPPGMFTPTGPALDMVVDKLPDPTLAVDKIIGPQIVVLATDGEPNSCGSMDLFALPTTDYNPSLAAAMKLQMKHLKMYVISVAEASGEFANHLQQMANIGQGLPATMNPGAEVYYPEDPAALGETLKTLIGAELSCDLALEGKGVKMGLECMGHVKLNGQELECNGQDGWELTDETHIKLKGTACDVYKDAVDAALTAEFPCEVIKTI